MALGSATKISSQSDENSLGSKSFIIFKRNDQNCYIYQQILEACFPNVPQSTVRRWLRTIGKSVIRTNSLERQRLSKLGLMPYRYLIREDDLREVLQHSKTRRKYQKRNSQLSTQSVPSNSSVCLPHVSPFTIADTPSDICNTNSQHDASVFLIDANLPSIISTTIGDVANFGDLIQSNVQSINASTFDLPNVISTTATNDDLGITLQTSASNGTVLDVGYMHDLVGLDENLSSNANTCISPGVVNTTRNDDLRETIASNVTVLSLGVDENLSSIPIPSTFNSPSLVNTTTTTTTTNNDLGNTLELSLSNATVLSLNDDEQLSSNASPSTFNLPNVVNTPTNNDIGNTLGLRASNATVVVDANSKVGCLPKEAISPALKLSLDQLKDFYTVTVNPLRHCHKFCTSTANKFIERVSCFLNYCRINGPHHELKFDLVNNFEIVQDYINYQLNARQLNISTVVRTVTALINLSKYVHRLCANIEACIELIRLRNIQHQLSQEQRTYNMAVKAGLGGNDTNTFMFSHILETMRKLREKVDSSKGDTGHMRILHDFVLLSLYLTSMCGRSKELRTLQLFHELKEGKTFHFDWKKRCNVLVVSADERQMTIYENDFKTLRSHGPSKFEMDQSMWLISYLKEYIAGRETILCGQTHPYMFATVKGLPFHSSSFTNYLSKMFEREVNLRAGTTKLRHALVTHVMSLPEAENLKLRESLASLMRHSMKHQQVTYCDISRQDRTLLSRDLLNKSVEEATKIATESSTTVATLDRNSSVEASPCGEISVGNIVALLDSVSTCAEQAVVFVGKILKIRGNEVLLMEFRQVEGRKNFYRAVVDSSWWENANSIIFPIDIVYDGKEQAYELRSSVAEIYNAVYV